MSWWSPVCGHSRQSYRSTAHTSLQQLPAALPSHLRPGITLSTRTQPCRWRLSAALLQLLMPWVTGPLQITRPGTIPRLQTMSRQQANPCPSQVPCKLTLTSSYIQPAALLPVLKLTGAVRMSRCKSLQTAAPSQLPTQRPGPTPRPQALSAKVCMCGAHLSALMSAEAWMIKKAAAEAGFGQVLLRRSCGQQITTHTFLGICGPHRPAASTLTAQAR